MTAPELAADSRCMKAWRVQASSEGTQPGSNR
jgi:hypothetical protein